MKKAIYLIMILTIYSCDYSKFDKTPETKFLGIWKYESSNLYNGLVIEISKNKNGNLIGIVKKTNNNKLVSFFVDSNFVIFSEIKRTSNFEFSISQNRIGKELFSLYELKTKDNYKAQFLNQNEIGICSSENFDKNNLFIKLVKIRQ